MPQGRTWRKEEKEQEKKRETQQEAPARAQGKKMCETALTSSRMRSWSLTGRLKRQSKHGRQKRMQAVLCRDVLCRK